MIWQPLINREGDHDMGKPEDLPLSLYWIKTFGGKVYSAWSSLEACRFDIHAAYTKLQAWKSWFTRYWSLYSASLSWHSKTVYYLNCQLLSRTVFWGILPQAPSQNQSLTEKEMKTLMQALTVSWAGIIISTSNPMDRACLQTLQFGEACRAILWYFGMAFRSNRPWSDNWIYH